MIIHEMEQYSPEWWRVRRGIPTSSKADKIVTPAGKFSTQSRAYINELIADELGFGDEPMEPNEWMIRGTDLEPEARRSFEFVTDQTIIQVGFVTNDDGTFGCSPDGLICPGESEYESGWETKCPKASTHIGYLLDGGLPGYYKPQVHMSMAATGLRKWVFQSYYPGLPPLIVPVEWDDYTDNVAAALVTFTENLNQAKALIKNRAD